MRYLMPTNDSDALVMDASYILPTESGGAFDVAAARSVLWMVQDGQVRGLILQPGPHKHTHFLSYKNSSVPAWVAAA